MTNAALFEEDCMIGSYSPAPLPAKTVVLPETLNSVDAIVKRRVRNLEFIQKTLTGEAYWMNQIKFSKDEVRKYFEESSINKGSIIDWFSLSLTLGEALEVEETVEALQQAFSEWQAITGEAKWPDKIQRFKDIAGPIERTYYQFANIPGKIDGVQLLLSLCDIFLAVYRKLQKYESQPTAQQDINKLDAQFKDIIQKISSDLHSLGVKSMKKQLSSIQALVDANA